MKLHTKFLEATYTHTNTHCSRITGV